MAAILESPSQVPLCCWSWSACSCGTVAEKEMRQDSRFLTFPIEASQLCFRTQKCTAHRDGLGKCGIRELYRFSVQEPLKMATTFWTTREPWKQKKTKIEHFCSCLWFCSRAESSEFRACFSHLPDTSDDQMCKGLFKCFWEFWAIGS